MKTLTPLSLADQFAQLLADIGMDAGRSGKQTDPGLVGKEAGRVREGTAGQAPPPCPASSDPCWIVVPSIHCQNFQRITQL